MLLTNTVGGWHQTLNTTNHYLSRRWNRDRRDDEFEALSQNQELKKGLLAFGNFGGNLDTFDKTLEKFSIYCKQPSTRYF
ncbi:hypothetical protein SAMN06265222_1011027 [Neorhodopirellula lusitana]|uniref:Uncharacterized protein n=1 Tax=Neorhodopirellula lusitana TaxID=445327 RepID=A0ABY1PS82_9BACT|nr:hypothetical protein [Neorhodopirellula lusitana]SMP43893.1 hypothetical protein SAMN06265222_1011027 [Neorhodopirellula lusitana]